MQTATDQIMNIDATPKLHSLLSIFVAVAIGGALASGFLVYQNFIASNRQADAKRSIALFLAIGLIALITAWHTPPDFLSFMLSVGIPQITVTVLAAWNLQAALFAAHRVVGGSFRSVAFAFVVGFIANVVIKGLFYGISLATTA